MNRQGTALMGIVLALPLYKKQETKMLLTAMAMMELL